MGRCPNGYRTYQVGTLNKCDYGKDRYFNVTAVTFPIQFNLVQTKGWKNILTGFSIAKF